MKNKISIYTFLLLIIGLSSCKKLKIIKAPGEVEQKTFTATFPFEFRKGIIVIDVNLKGQIHEFVLDTGGFNLLDDEVAKAANINGETSIEISDSHDNNKKTPILKLDEIEIAGINFLKTGAGIVDFKDLNAIGCFELNGMIGANLMQNAVWKIDYQQQEITISHSMAAFDIPNNSHTIPFTTGTLKSPKIEVNLDGHTAEKVEIDLGSTGGFGLTKTTFDKLAKDKIATGTGLFSAGLYGYLNSETINFAIVNQLSLGDLELTNQLVTFKPNDNPIIGNEFLKNYQVILNWFDQEMILIPVTEPKLAKLENYGFKPIFKDGKPQIGFIYANSSADKVGLKITDQIIELAGENTKDISKEDWCTELQIFNQTTVNALMIKVFRAGKELTFDLVRTKLL